MDEHLLRFDKKKTYVFIDCETLNLCLNCCHNLPWQIGMIKLVGSKVIAQKDIFIKWDTELKISEDAARITRYNQKKIDKLGVKPEEIFATIEEWLDDADYIMGHNTLGFDIYLIKDYYKYMGKSAEHLYPKLIDTNALAKGIKMGIPFKSGDDLMEYQYMAYHKRKKGIRTNLTALGKEFDIDVDYDNLHDAVNDLMLNIEVWNKLKWQIDV
jgi:DNA polymerase III epsilon subunit-like protein